MSNQHTLCLGAMIILAPHLTQLWANLIALFILYILYKQRREEKKEDEELNKKLIELFKDK